MVRQMTVVDSRPRIATNGENGRAIYPLLRRMQLSKFLSDPQTNELESFCRSVTRPAGQTLFRQGEEPTTLYLVVRGEVELRARPPGRRAYRTVEVVGPGCTLGDEAVLEESHYLCSARVQEPSKLLALSRSEFVRLQDIRPDIAMAILQCAGGCLIQTVRRSAILTQAPADVALEILLRELSAEAAQNGKQGAVRITHAQLAGLLHLSRETVSRMLGQMASEGLVELSRGAIRIRSDHR
jgi:CRP-like cAMP-binding protein